MTTDKTEPFFKQLYKLSHHIDTSINELHGKLEEKIDFNCDNSKSISILHGTKKEVKHLKKEAQTTFADFTCNGNKFGRVLSACQNFIDASRNQLNNIEEHLSSYGYTRQVAETENEDNDVDDDEDVDNEEDDDDEETGVVKNGKSKDMTTTPSPTKNKKKEVSRTPKLEDFGISSFGMQAMFRYPQNKQSSVRPSDIRDETMEPSSGQYHTLDSVPQAFEHNGLTVTPSIVGMFQWPPQTPDSCTPAQSFKNSLYYQNNTFSPEVFSQKSRARVLESPAPPAFCTPGINQLNKVQINDAVPPQPSFTNDLDSPAPPVFQTPGMKYTGNIIKESIKYGDILENKVSKDYNMLEEPEVPELTMTFQEISQLTNYKSKKTAVSAEEVHEPQKPMGLKAKFGYDADIDTPPHLELLSSRLIKMGIAPSDSPYKTKTPPQPTLLSRYKRRGNQENIAP